MPASPTLCDHVRTRSRATPRAVCIALVVIIAGCSSQRAQEASALTCSDGRDNDVDDLFDCSDPDCQAYDQCRVQGGDPVVSPPRDAGQRPLPTPVTGGGSGGGAAAGIGGGGGDIDEDAGPLPPAVPPDPSLLPCQSMCTATQACIDDRCEEVSAPSSGSFGLLVLSATAPIRDFTTRCYDFDCGGSPFATCRCAPDPYVRAVRVRSGEERDVGITSAVMDELNPTFSDPPFTIQLEPGDALQLEVWDSDPQPEPDELLYQCTADLRMLMGGPIECSIVLLPGFPPHRVNAELQVLP